MSKLSATKTALQMPPDAKLDERQIELLTKWVMLGMPWPSADSPGADKPERTKVYEFTAEQKRFWSFQQLACPVPPQVERADWVKNDVDRFILARLDEQHMSPAGASATISGP